MTPLGSGQVLLRSAVSYALAGAGLAAPGRLAWPTPCPGWDLERMLGHLGDSIAGLREAIGPAGAAAGGGAAPGDPGPGCAPGSGPAGWLRGEAAGLLAACAAAGPGHRRVTIGDRKLTVNMVAVTGALEIAVHGWDIFAACGARRPVPPGLATVLLPIAPLLVTPATRPGLFADPVRLTGPASPGDQLVAFLGRPPAWDITGRPAAAPS